MTRRGRWLALAPACVILVTLLTSCDRGKAPPALPRIDLDGLRAVIAQAAAQRQVLVIDFWATWCAPCVEIFPAIHEGVAGLGPGVRLVSVTLDAPGKGEANAIAFLTKNHALDDARMLAPDTDARLRAVEGLGNKWNSLVVPAILVYDRDGRLDGEFLGDVGVEPILVRARQLLSAHPAATRP